MIYTALGVILIIIGVLFDTIEINKGLNIYNGIISALGGGFIIYIINYFSAGKIGEGDIKLIMSLGFFMGLKEIYYLILYSFIIGGIFSLVMLSLRKYKRNDEIPFIPFVFVSLCTNTPFNM